MRLTEALRLAASRKPSPRNSGADDYSIISPNVAVGIEELTDDTNH